MRSTLFSLVPMLHVASVARSIEFYAQLGFVARDTFAPSREDALEWAWIQSGGASLMLVQASAPVSGAPIILCIYCDDVQALHRELREAGVPVEELTYSSERPGGAFRVADPDRYDLAFTHK